MQDNNPLPPPNLPIPPCGENSPIFSRVYEKHWLFHLSRLLFARRGVRPSLSSVAGGCPAVNCYQVKSADFRLVPFVNLEIEIFEKFLGCADLGGDPRLFERLTFLFEVVSEFEAISVGRIADEENWTGWSLRKDLLDSCQVSAPFVRVGFPPLPSICREGRGFR